MARSHGFAPTGEGLTWRQVFDPYNDLVEGRTVAVIGHFPFARAALWKAGDVQILERDVRSGDYPDTACEYLLPEADYVFISSSSLVNKTAPRLVALGADAGAHVVLVGPSTPMHPLWLDLGVDMVTGWVPDASVRPDRPHLLPEAGQIGPGSRMHLGKAPSVGSPV